MVTRHLKNRVLYFSSQSSRNHLSSFPCDLNMKVISLQYSFDVFSILHADQTLYRWFLSLIFHIFPKYENLRKGFRSFMKFPWKEGVGGYAK